MTGAPIFLFIITDKQWADWPGCAGHPVPCRADIDVIATRGVCSDGLHVAFIVCMRNRASPMTGRLPRVHRLRCTGCARRWR